MSGPLPTLSHGAIRLAPLVPAHRAALKAACAADRDIWEIYSIDLRGDAFDRWFDGVMATDPPPAWRMWAVHLDDVVVGMTGLAADPRHPGVVEVGTTYYVPAVRGTGLNRVVKWLVLGHLFASGTHRAEFRVDVRNARSTAAVLKLGAQRDGVLRRHKITHTGHIRDTGVFAILDTEWPAIAARLEP